MNRTLKSRRKLWLNVHLYLGLFAGAVFVLIGLTGSLLTFEFPLDEWLNPKLMTVPVDKENKSHLPLDTIVASGLQALPADGKASAIGFYLTLPLFKKSALASEIKAQQASFLQRWKPAWKVKWQASKTRINFDLHRAGGLWLWFILIIFAWSSVYMNLADSVYTKATQCVFDYHESWTEIPELTQPIEQAKLSWRDAYAQAVKLSEQAALNQHFQIEYPVYLSLNRSQGVYVYKFRTSLDIQDKFGNTQLIFDANTGEQKLLLLPTGQYSGNTITTWLMALHMANVFGLPYRIVVCVLGLAIVMLSVTGVIIWLKKRRATRQHQTKKITVDKAC